MNEKKRFTAADTEGTEAAQRKQAKLCVCGGEMSFEQRSNWVSKTHYLLAAVFMMPLPSLIVTI